MSMCQDLQMSSTPQITKVQLQLTAIETQLDEIQHKLEESL